MSRAVWVAVGAIGGIYAYRRGQRALNQARERGFVGNVQAAMGTAATMAQGANRLVALANPAPPPAPPANPYSIENQLQRVQVTPVRRTPIGQRPVRVPAGALRLSALKPNDGLPQDGPSSEVVDIRRVQSSAAG